MFPRIPPGSPPPAYELPPSYQDSELTGPATSTTSGTNNDAPALPPPMAPLGVEGGYEQELRVFASPSPAPVGDSNVHGITATNTERLPAPAATSSNFTRADDTFSPTAPTPRRPLKRSAAVVLATTSDAPAPAAPAIEFELYAHVNIPVKAKAGSRSKQAPKPVTQKFGPLSLKSNIKWEGFLEAISMLVSSSPPLLAIDTFEWKYTKPKNSSLFPLRNAAALASMLVQVEKKIPKDGSVFIILEMSPPAVVQQQNVPWASSSNTSAPLPPTNPDEDSDDAEGPSRKRARYDDEVEEIIAKLLDKYPPGQCSDHPKISCFSLGPSGLHFELSRVRCIVWAAAIRQGQASLDKAPISKDIFKAKHALPKTPAPAPAPPSTPQAGSSMPVPGVGFPQAAFNPYLMAPPFFPHYNMGMPMHPMMPFPSPTSPMHHGHTTTSTTPDARGSSPPLPECTIADFCQQYGLGESVESSLEILGFEIGDNIRAVPSDDWKAAGFTFLSWERTCRAYDKYKRSARLN